MPLFSLGVRPPTTARVVPPEDRYGLLFPNDDVGSLSDDVTRDCSRLSSGDALLKLMVAVACCCVLDSAGAVGCGFVGTESPASRKGAGRSMLSKLVECRSSGPKTRRRLWKRPDASSSDGSCDTEFDRRIWTNRGDDGMFIGDVVAVVEVVCTDGAASPSACSLRR